MKNSLTLDLIRYGFYAFLHNAKRLNRKVLSLSTTLKDLPIENFTMEMLKDAARQLGINVEYLGDGAYEFKLRNVTRRIREGLRIDLDNAFSFWLCGNKYITFQLLEKYGIKNIPYYNLYSIGTIKNARRDFLARERAVVVKPCFGTTSGKGVTVSIRNMRDLDRAIFTALLYDKHYLIEDFIEGHHFRLLFFKGKMIGALKRLPANVKGDGVNNINELIKLNNDRRSEDKSDLALYPIIFDNEVMQTLKNNNMSLDYIPNKNEKVYVKSIANFNSGGEVEDVSNIVNKNVIDYCEKLIKIMNISLAGIDIITKDITKPLNETGGVVNEVNTSPSLEIHYKVRNQNERKDVSKEILKLMFEIVQ